MPGILDCALAGYAASLLGDGVGLHHRQSCSPGRPTSKAVYRILGTLIGAAGTIVAGPEPRQCARNCSASPLRCGSAFVLLSLADRRHTAQLRVHAGRLHRRAARLSHRLSASVDFRHRRRPRAGNHCSALSVRASLSMLVTATERRLCNLQQSGRLARRMHAGLAWMSSPAVAAIRSVTTNASALPPRLPKSTSLAGISAMRPPLPRIWREGLQRLRQHMLSLLPLLGSIEDRKLALNSDEEASARICRNLRKDSAVARSRAVTMDREAGCVARSA